ncbi:MAG: LacI family DNA-binding transcriptional regulator [Pseudomonadota bacterium]
MAQTLDRPDQPRPVTMRDIAEHLGLSVTTVARSLKDGHKTGADTVARVRDAAERLGYARNLDGLRLRTGRTMTLLAVLGASDDPETGDISASSLLLGVHRRLQGTDYSVQAKLVDIGDPGIPALRKMIRTHAADGVILNYTEPNDARVRLLTTYGIPFVTLGRTDMGIVHPWFDLDHEDAAWQGTKALISQGYRRIAMMESLPGYTFVQKRLSGHRRALAEAGISFDPALVAHNLPGSGIVHRATQRLLQEAKPDAFLCCNEVYLIGTVAGLRDICPTLVGKFGLFVRSGSNLPAYLAAPIAASYYSRTEVGWQLCDLLLQRINGVDAARLQRLERTELRHALPLPRQHQAPAPPIGHVA